MTAALSDITFLLANISEQVPGNLASPENKAELVPVCGLAMQGMGHEITLHWCPASIIEQSGNRRERTVWAMELQREGVWLGIEPLLDQASSLALGREEIIEQAKCRAATLGHGVVFEIGEWETVPDIATLASTLDTINSTAAQPRALVEDMAAVAEAVIRAHRLDAQTSPAKAARSLSSRL